MTASSHRVNTVGERTADVGHLEPFFFWWAGLKETACCRLSTFRSRFLGDPHSRKPGMIRYGRNVGVIGYPCKMDVIGVSVCDSSRR
jgi:hypothetical protein